MEIPISSITSRNPAPPLQQKASSSIWNREVRWIKPGLPVRVRMEFYRELHLMFTTGIDLRMALEIFAEQIVSKKHQPRFRRILDAVSDGSTLSMALQNENAFSNYEFQNIRIGEESGTLPHVLGQLTQYFTSRLAQSRQLTGALSYPALVFLTSVGAVVFMLQVVVPMFEDVFKRFGSDLPYLTKLIIAFSEFMSDYFYLILLIVAAAGVLFTATRRTVIFRKYSAQLLLKIPFFGAMIKAAHLGKFASAMHLLCSAHHPLDQSIRLVKEMVGFYPIQKSLEDANAQLLRGAALSEVLRHHPFYPGKLIALLKMGEEVNKLDVIFEQIRDQCSEDLQYRSSILGNVLEPVLIIFIGALVGFILIAMYLPLFNLSTSIG